MPPNVLFCGPVALARGLANTCQSLGLTFRYERFQGASTRARSPARTVIRGRRPALGACVRLSPGAARRFAAIAVRFCDKLLPMSPGVPRLLLCSSLLACGSPPSTSPTTTESATQATSSSTGGGSTDGGSTTSTSTGDVAPTTAADPGGTGTAGGTTGTSGTSGGSEPFVLDCHTEFTRAQRLALACNLPMSLAACQRLGDAPCADVDLDGLTDAWEDLALELLRPLRRFDEAESLIDDPAAVLADVGRVAPAGERVRVFVMLGYSKDYGSCGGFTGHNGDSERVALDLQPDPSRGPGGVVVVGAYTAAHEGTVNDHGAVFVGDDLGALVFAADTLTADPRWVVFPSADKHATYASVSICEGVSPIPCIDEDCAPDDVDDPAAYERLPPFVNAGEEDAPRITDLGPLGFPGDDAWADQDFCGGLGGTGCSSPVREKLLVDPF